MEQIQARPPRRQVGPVRALVWRVAMALGLVALVAVTVWLGRDGYVDDAGGPVTWLDAFYYASVSVTTTGYGDITPVTPETRLATTLIITPARVAFLLLLVGTTVELLTERWREAHRRNRWRDTISDHYVICGYGVKGRSAARALCEDGVPRNEVVIVDEDANTAGEASTAGYTTVLGEASRTAVLREARVERAKAVIVATDRDDSAVLTTLTARELAPRAMIVAAAREEENAPLLRQSGADEVIISAETAGRLLGMTSLHPSVGEVVNDLLHTAHGLALDERGVAEGEVGERLEDIAGQRTIAVEREGTLLRYDDPALGRLQRGDRLVGLPRLRRTRRERRRASGQSPSRR